MNPLLNPFVSIPLLKGYIFDSGRLQKYNKKQMQKYRDKAFKKTIKYAYTVPLYHKKYKEAGVHPNDIHGIKDIVKLPFVSKKDFVENYPSGLLPVGYNDKHFFTISTGGTTGKPVSIFTNFYTMARSGFISIREQSFFDLNWRKSKFVHIGNFSSGRVDLVAEQNLQSHLKTFFSMKNQLNINVDNPMIDIIKQLDRFQPDIIMAYPAIFQHLAYLKRKGHGKNIKPKLFWTGGAMLDDYTRRYVEDSFKCRMLNIYPSVEAGADIAFECLHGTWHIHHDFFHVEAIDENNEIVAPGKRGHIALTRLWGTATPIIRYTGMDDWVKLSDYYECECGLKTPILIDGVEGRKRANIVLPNGKVFPPGAFCFISPILHKYKTFKVKQYQVIQKKIDQIEILIVIDEELRNEEPSFTKLANDIKQIYQEKTGPDVEIIVREVNEIKNKKNAGKPPPIVVSELKPEEGYKVFKTKD